jgi:hypothetical protein
MATRIILDDSDKIGLVVIRASDGDQNGNQEVTGPEVKRVDYERSDNTKGMPMRTSSFYPLLNPFQIVCNVFFREAQGSTCAITR